MTQAARLQLARKRAGYARAIDAINAFGFNRTTYFQHENGTRPIGKESALRYAKIFRVSVDWLLFNRGSGPSFKVPVVAHVGAGGEIVYLDDHAKGGGLEEIDAPPGCPPKAVACLVRGNSMMSRYPEGRVIIYWHMHTDPSAVIGEDCVVRLADGRTLLKQVMPGARRGRWTLVSTDAPIMQDVEIEWAAPVEIVLRRINWNEATGPARRLAGT
jgi:phage repressor protein C with HTH and peptisase S24 domain